MIRRSLPLHRSLAALALAAASFALAGAASAAGPKEAAARKALQQAVDEDYLETRFDDAETKLRNALVDCGSACPAHLRAQLHAALGAVLATGKKELDDARDEFIDALILDPKIEPDPGMISTGVTFAFEQAKKKLKIGPAAPPEPKNEPAEKPSKPEKKAPEPLEPIDEPKARDADKDPSEAPKDLPPARRNWITLTFSPDLSIVSGTNVCTKESQANGHYVCFRQDETRYQGTPTKDNGDNINTGIGLSTLRVMVAYDRLVIDNLTLGARVGFAFNGAGGEGVSFLPVHLEGRLGYWPGKTPFVGHVVRPYMMISGGVAQVDTKVTVQVLEDGKACGAKNPSSSSSPCTLPTGNPEKRVQSLTAYKQAGLGFGSLAFGVHFVPSPVVALYLAARINVTFPVVTGVISPEGGVAFGF